MLSAGCDAQFSPFFLIHAVVAIYQRGRSPGYALRDGDLMPHVNDKRAFNECTRLLGGPKQLHLNARLNGRRIVDTPHPGQQEFQALLLWCLLSPTRSIDWDRRIGRSFRDMFLYYSWASPQPERLSTGWTVAARVASYLLPSISIDDRGEARCGGVPGLRYASNNGRSIQLRHLPTGGTLELVDNRRHEHQDLREFLGFEASRAQHHFNRRPVTPVWEKPTLTSTEFTELRQWFLAQHAPLLSAMMARIDLLWRHFFNRAELDINPRSKCPRLSWWAGPTTMDFVTLLIDSPIAIDNVRAFSAGDQCRALALGDAALELRGPGDDQ
ncbi:hypothetical protein Amac_060480 [Acrocarpospora macrocephala]|uniref:Uncharacterized protein n=1 Tax=Acrocarpospora macrocephala TaxID=150177 RepID=A0A5M3WYP1_9ACTN|nr:hypothetical protein Amac_060480 [Acrocarpospora macrocephala]